MIGYFNKQSRSLTVYAPYDPKSTQFYLLLKSEVCMPITKVQSEFQKLSDLLADGVVADECTAGELQQVHDQLQQAIISGDPEKLIKDNYHLSMHQLDDLIFRELDNFRKSKDYLDDTALLSCRFL